MKFDYEAPANMQEKIKQLAQRSSQLCAVFYVTCTEQQKEKVLELYDQLIDSMVAYRKYEIPWDSKLIDAREKIQVHAGDTSVYVKTKVFSTSESVMDLARKLFVFISQAEEN